MAIGNWVALNFVIGNIVGIIGLLFVPGGAAPLEPSFLNYISSKAIICRQNVEMREIKSYFGF